MPISDLNPKNTTLGAMEATDYKAIYGANATFDGQAIDTTAVLIKYTYYGDADFRSEPQEYDAGRNGSHGLQGDLRRECHLRRSGHRHHRRADQVHLLRRCRFQI